MATWYRGNRNRNAAKREQLVSSDALPRSGSTARHQPSWCQLRARMETSEILEIAWIESIGTYSYEEENTPLSDTNSAAPIEATVAVKKIYEPLVGTRIDAQVIAINRTFSPLPISTPSAANKGDFSMMRLEQLSHGSMYRLAGVRG